ncbi:DNA polymerase delta subunit 2-like [Amphiura filiformis]|uniref:DNA polymerase delta subunit 2-like n=1 Tax=Amphiura filiformis TaxID=82378 RepID=UPI003B21E3EB
MEEDGVLFQRPASKYENLSSRFLLKERNFQRQYAHLYSERLKVMFPLLRDAAKKKWGNKVNLKKLFEMTSGEKCCVIGTLFKRMELKPNILKEISKDLNLVPQPPRRKYVSDSDELILEDDLQRIVLVGDIDVHKSITGVVIAVYGQERDDGKFEVDDYCLTYLPTQAPAAPLEEDRYIVLMSGLGIGEDGHHLMNLQLLVDLITGQLGTAEEQEKFSKVIRVIVAGNSLSAETQQKDILNTAKYLTRKTKASTVDAVRGLDDILVQLASSVPVDVMPGEYDPGHSCLPQQPLHKCMFPQATIYPTMHSVTNPYEASIDGIRILGTSGQNVTDIFHFTSFEDHMEILETTLKAGHLAPTAPDTLSCYPYYDKDPLIISDCPTIYFAGNQPKFQSRLWKGDSEQQVLLVTIPKFIDTQACVMVNLRTLDCQPLVFSSQLTSTNGEA